MRIAICDDEKLFSLELSAVIDRLYNSLDMIVDEYSSGADLLKKFQNKNYDLLFLDIEMPGIDGISLAGRLREYSESVYIVFLTSHIEYALKVYEVNALRYLTKPAKAEDIREVIEYILKKHNDKKSIWVKNSEGEFKITLSDIIYIESWDQNVIINTTSGDITVRGKLSDYEAQLKSDGFFRIHRSYVVSLSKIVSVSGRSVRVSSGGELPLGRTKESEFKRALVAFAASEAI